MKLFTIFVKRNKTLRKIGFTTLGPNEFFYLQFRDGTRALINKSIRTENIGFRLLDSKGNIKGENK